MDYVKTIGANIRYERRKRGLTIDDFAHVIGMASGFLGLIERGQRGTSISNLVKICNFFDITLDQLITQDLSKGEPAVKEVENTKETKSRTALHSYANTLSPEIVDHILTVIKSLSKLYDNGEFGENK